MTRGPVVQQGWSPTLMLKLSRRLVIRENLSEREEIIYFTGKSRNEGKTKDGGSS